MNRKHVAWGAGLALLGSLGLTALAGSGDLLLDAVLQRPKSASGTTVVPDRFLRRWDAITVFHAGPVGPKGGGPEDDPSVRLTPDHPGAWTWLDARTLQFRPTIPWTPMSTVSVRADGRTTELHTLTQPPVQTEPGIGSRGLDPVASIELTFNEPLPADALARLTTIELRPLPGLSDAGLVVLDRDDFEVKTLERASDREPGRYALILTEPIPRGVQARVRIGLSLDTTAEEAVWELVFATAEPFRPTRMGCGSSRVPVAPTDSTHPAEQPLVCTDARQIVVDFNANLADIGPIEGRNLIRFEPAVDGLSYETAGDSLIVRGGFREGIPYRVALTPTPLRDVAGRTLDLTGESVAWFVFPRQEPYVRWGAGQGIVERFGPRRVPIQGRGTGQVDLRVHAVDPENRELWPFPSSPIGVDENQRPPGPGEGPVAIGPTDEVSSSGLRTRLGMLGSPGFSRIVDLGLEGGDATSGLDLTDPLTTLSGANAPGHYLVGMRRVDGAAERQWMRVQVTDLALSTLESEDAVTFLVTSLSTGKPVPGARIGVDAVVHPLSQPARFERVVDVRTDAQGRVTWNAPGRRDDRQIDVERLVVSKADDVLVLDADQAPERFEDGVWNFGGDGWLQWAFWDLAGRKEQPQVLAHLFTERPVYRPEEDVYLKGYVRSRYQGELSVLPVTGDLEITGPGGSTWRLPVSTSKTGSVDAVWSESDIPSGTYQATWLDGDDNHLASTTFNVESYRLPTFEVDLSTQDDLTRVPNDRPFELRAVASYYAGGKVANRPVRWTVTQFPASWSPEGPEGFVYSSDSRYGRSARFDASPALDHVDQTDTAGLSTLQLDPGIEADASPRTYVVEATVTGADDDTVTATHRVQAVPAFTLGLKVPRWLETADAIPVQAVSVGPDGALLADRDVTVRLIQRQWHSVLQASDFSDGVARYVTDVVDVPVLERAVRTGSAPSALSLPIPGAGVYIVELEASDALGRTQVVSVDLYAGGKGDVTWSKAEAGRFEITPDKATHRPGETANLVLRSPFQTGEALVVIEAPTGNRYQSVAVVGGKATASIRIEEGWVPSVPVHVLLRRGRVAGAGVVGQTDLGKPETLGTTVWLPIEPVENTVEVALSHPEQSLPGKTVDVTVKLSDPDGKPLSGEVTLWLVDQAVLALGTEARLDPKPDFIPDRISRFSAHDTRNTAFGSLPYAEMPGGDGGDEDRMEEEGILDNTAIRQDFKAVPYWEPSLAVGPSGTLTVKVALPDNLTVFKLRAKAVSGAERFGVGTSSLRVRLPVLVQPDLPRFVRPGDTLEVAALGRIVEGDGGAGSAEVSVDGLALKGPATTPFTWDADQAVRIAWPVEVQTPAMDPSGRGQVRSHVQVTMGAKRSADGAADAVRVDLPLMADRRARTERVILDLAAGARGELPALEDPARPGTLSRSVVVSDHPGLVRMVAGMDVFLARPSASSGQHLDRARAWLGLGQIRDAIGLQGEELTAEIVRETLEWLPATVDGNGLVAAWPGGTGQIGLTADALLFLEDAKDAGYTVDGGLRDGLIVALKQSLRSDYAWFLDGASWTERSRALEALASAGAFDEAYFTQLADNARLLGPEGQAFILLAASRAGKAESPLAQRLIGSLDDEVVVALYEGAPRYRGLKTVASPRDPRILASETYTLATMARAMGRGKGSEKLPLVVDALVRVGGEDGWGGRADAPALLALAERLNGRTATPVAVNVGGQTVAARAGIERRVLDGSGALPVAHASGPAAAVLGVARYVPMEPGSLADARNRGFVVSREHVRVTAAGAPTRVRLDEGGRELALKLGDVVEDHVQIVNPEPRAYVAVELPFAAGLEPLNPNLLTAPPEARPANGDTVQATFVDVQDSRVVWYFEQLPKGTYDLYFRSRAMTPGRFVQPPATGDLVFDPSIVGSSPGAWVVVGP